MCKNRQIGRCLKSIWLHSNQKSSRNHTSDMWRQWQMRSRCGIPGSLWHIAQDAFRTAVKAVIESCHADWSGRTGICTIYVQSHRTQYVFCYGRVEDYRLHSVGLTLISSQNGITLTDIASINNVDRVFLLRDSWHIPHISPLPNGKISSRKHK